jgi:hemolysin activation/secretion protein
MIQGTLSYSQALPEGYTLAASLSGQYADDTVPQNSQWVIGGLGNLTAWLPAILVGDSGALGRLAVSTPSRSWGRFSYSGNVFVEAGMVRSHYRPLNEPTTRALGDAGLSLTGNIDTGTSIVLAYAWPVWYRNVDRNAINVQGRANVYFSLNQSF